MLRIFLGVLFYIFTLVAHGTQSNSNVVLLDASGSHLCAATKNQVKCWNDGTDHYAIKFKTSIFNKIEQLVLSTDTACIIADGRVHCGDTYGSESFGASVIERRLNEVANPARITTIRDYQQNETYFCVMSATDLKCSSTYFVFGPSISTPLLPSPKGPIGDFPFSDIVAIDGSLCLSSKSGIFCWGYINFGPPTYKKIEGSWHVIPLENFREKIIPINFSSVDQVLCGLNKSGNAYCVRPFSEYGEMWSPIRGGKIRDKDGNEPSGIVDIIPYNRPCPECHQWGVCLRFSHGPIQCKYTIGDDNYDIPVNKTLDSDILSMGDFHGMRCYVRSNNTIDCSNYRDMMRYTITF